MGRNGIGVSGFALTVSKAIRSQLGVRRMSGRDLAKAIGRGETYVRDRINDDKEWALGDIERMCKLWHITPGQLIDCNSVPSVPDEEDLDAIAAREQEKLEQTRRFLREGYGIAANTDEHKYEHEDDQTA
ncbi:helix-turn-helix domain-containing protein [Bifidobacterium ramosum]|nr:helix-turn-helix domain-containing protein [Bifidobacterium ramosum]